MTFQTKAADFRRAIAVASKAVEGKSTIPILQTVRCRANGAFEATATDLGVLISVSVPREPGEDMDFALMSPKQVVAAIGAAGGADVSISHVDGKAALQSGALELSVGTLPGDDFPEQSFNRPLDPQFSATLSAENVAALGRVAGAMSTEETRYYLNGLHFRSIGDTTIRVQATDGHRLYFLDIEVPDATGTLPSNTIIPRRTVRLLLDLAKTASGPIAFKVGNSALSNAVESTAPARAGATRLAVSFDTGAAKVSLASKLIDGTFPDTSRIIPTGGDKQMLFNVADLRRALSGISGHSRDVRATKITLGEPGIARLSAAYVGLSLSAEIEVQCQHDAPGFVVGFNGNYLLSLLNASGGEELLIDTADAATPALIRNPADTAWAAVQMPMRV